MKLIRTEGGGTFHETDRLLRVEEKLKSFPKIQSNIIMLEDHKGTLNVYWYSYPNDFEKDLLNNIWFDENEYLLNHLIFKSELINEVRL